MDHDKFTWQPDDLVLVSEAKAFDQSEPRDEHGRWSGGAGVAVLPKPTWQGRGPFVGSDHGTPYVGVPAGTVPAGEEAYRMHQQPYQPGGHQIRGKGIAWDDPHIPETVYHVTTNLPAVLDSGYLRAGGVGGLGGDNADRIVSMTIDRKIAEQLVPDIQLAATVSKIDKIEPHFDENHKVWVAPGAAEFTKKVFDVLDADAAKYGFTFDGLGARDPFNAANGSTNTYDTGDWLRQYLSERQHVAGVQNPIIMTDKAMLAKIDPTRVGIISIPRQNLNTGAQLTDFDLERQPPYSLQEVRLYGDLPIGPQSKGLGSLLFGGSLVADAIYLISESRRKHAEEEARARAEDEYRDTHGGPWYAWNKP